MEGIKKFYKRQAIDLIMFGHVRSLTSNLPFSVEKAVLNFMKEYKLEDENKETLCKTYFRMQKELFDSLKTDG